MDLAVLRDRRARRVDDDVRVVDAITRRAGLVEPAEAQPEAVAPRERPILFEARAVERFGLCDGFLRARADERERLCLLYTSPSPRDRQKSRMPSSA